MDHLSDAVLLPALIVLLCLPFVTGWLWRRADIQRRRREMREGNRIYKEWLDSSASRQRGD